MPDHRQYPATPTRFVPPAGPAPQLITPQQGPWGAAPNTTYNEPPRAIAPQPIFYAGSPAQKPGLSGLTMGLIAGSILFVLILTGVALQTWQNHTREHQMEMYNRYFGQTGGTNTDGFSNPNNPDAQIDNAATMSQQPDGGFPAPADRRTTVSIDPNGNRVTRTTDSNGNVSISTEPAAGAGNDSDLPAAPQQSSPFQPQ